MKLKTVLKVVNSAKIRITVQADGTYYDYIIDYTAKDRGLKDYGVFAECDSITYLPENVLNRDVTYVEAFEGEVVICLYDKAYIEKLKKETNI